MDPQRWQTVKAIFEEATACPQAERAAFVEDACAGDADLRREVDALLAAHDEATPFLDDPFSSDAFRVLAAEGTAAMRGMTIGPYRIVRLLGRGGMGAVYLAERDDGQFEQSVALKLVRAGAYREDLFRRFRHERQILASLSHPHIARLLDGGLSEEGPYLVMEYVEGVPLDVYADRHRLPIAARLRLFMTVCEAVHYAHQNLIVHRDLKPSNILVTEEGTVKLLDFGIARLMDENAAAPQATRTGARLMTPAYASPEQVTGGAITTATDVYALGVILYELLAGHRPYHVHGRTPSAVEQLIVGQMPSRPSTAVLLTEAWPNADGTEHLVTPEAIGAARGVPPERLRRRLRGDLDTVVLKALQKDPARRYESAAQFGDDLRRHLARLPVIARPDTMGYRVTKFVRRHAVGVAASVLLLVVLLGGIIATTRQTRVAERRFTQVRSLANTLMSDLHDAIRDLPGATPARRLLVANALTYLDNLSQEAGDDVALQLELADAYEQIGEIQGNPHYTNLGDLDGAMESYHKAFAIREAIWLRDTTNAPVQHALGNTYGHAAVVTSWANDNPSAIGLSQKGLALLRPLAARDSVNVDILHNIGRIQSELGWWLIWEAKGEAGMAELHEAIALLERLAVPRPADLDLHLHLWRAYSYLIDGLRFSGRYAEALALIDDKALAHLHALERRYPTQPRVQYGLHVCYDYIGVMHQALGHVEQSVVPNETSLQYAEAMVLADSSNQKAHEAVARSYSSLGRLMGQLGRVEPSLEAYQKATTFYGQMYARNPQNHSIGNMLGNSQRLFCRVLLRAERLTEALKICLEGIRTYEELVSIVEESAVVRGNLAATYAYTAQSYRALALAAPRGPQRQRYRADALRWYDRALTILYERDENHSEYDREVYPDTLAAERDAFLLTVGE